MNSNQRRVLTRSLVCLIHAVWMMILSWLWMGLNYNMEIEENLVKWTSIVKRHTVVSSAYQDTISLAEYSFIDVSGAKKLIGREYSEGNFAITDRLLLDSLSESLRNTLMTILSFCATFFLKARQVMIRY